MRLKEGGTVPGNPRPSFYLSSPHTFSCPSWQQGSFCGIMCDPSCIHKRRLCPTVAWGLPRTAQEVLTRCWGPGPSAPRVGGEESFN